MGKIGVFSGTFDPVHRGHVEACVTALGALELGQVLMLIEKSPKAKKNVADFYDRANMLELAIMDYPSLKIVDLEADNITTDLTLDYLKRQFPDDEYWYIVGSDMLDQINNWPGHERLLEEFNLCVVLRDNQEQTEVEKKTKKLKTKILPSVWSPVSSSSVKKSLQEGHMETGLDPAVTEYIKRHGLYK